MKYLEGMIPLIKRLRETVEVEDEELRRVLGDEAPRLVVEGARRSIGDLPHRAYYIPWKCVEEPNACTSNKDVSRALELIKKVFDDKKIRIRWFKAEYVPPGLVEEVIDLIRVKGEDGAREELKGWVEAYSKAIDILRRVLGLGDDLFMWDELATGFLSNFVNNYASYIIGGLATALMDAATLALISVLTYMAFKREGEGYLKGIIELKRSLEKLRRPDGEFNELGKLLVYRVAYAMGMSYDETKKALIDITGLSIDELERRVNEIERRIEEIEVKVDELNRWVSLLKQKFAANIIIAGKVDFEQGIIYPNIKVENGELKIRAEDKYHNVVRAGKFNELISDVKSMLMGNGVVVVVGPKGIGKSTLVATVIWELLNNHEVGLVTRVDVLDSNNYHDFKTFVENYGKGFSRYFGRLLILYDPVSTKAYEKVGIDMKTPIQTNTELTIRNLVDVVNSISSEASRPFVFIVLPSDVYNVLSEERRDSLKRYSRDVSLNDVEFLAELIREYTKTRDKPNRCELSSDVLSQLASELVKFDSGHALIARLVGEELARNNCGVGKVEELINNAKGRAEAFIILQINGLFKVHENPDTVKALVEVFALRRPLVDDARPGDPIMTPGIIELIGRDKGANLLRSAEGKELRSWLARRQHDLIEEAIGKLLNCIGDKGKGCEVLGDALEPWKTIEVIELLRKISEKVRDVDSAVEYFASNYCEKLTDALRASSDRCWKRAIYIIGHALAGHSIVYGFKDLSAFLSMYLRKNDIESQCDDLSESRRVGYRILSSSLLAKRYACIVKSLGDALKECSVDDYLIVGDKIPQLVMGLIGNHACALAGAFIDKYDESVNEVKRLLNISKNRALYDKETSYGLGLAAVIANAVESGRPVEPSDVDVALYIASFASANALFTNPVLPILSVLAPLRDKAPQRYLEVLASALDRVFKLGMCKDWDTVMNILNEFSYILNKYKDRVEGHSWPLVDAIDALVALLSRCLEHCDEYWFEHMGTSFRTKLEHVVSRVAGLLDKINMLNPSLDIIAWSRALLPALKNKCVRALTERVLGIDIDSKAKEVARELSRLRGSVQELIRDGDFMGYVKIRFKEADEKAAKRVILEETSILKHSLAQYKLVNDELDEATRLFNEAAEESREIGDYINYLDNRKLALHTEAIKGPLAGDDLVKLVNGFRQLYEEAVDAERLMPASPYNGTLSKDILRFTLRNILGGYLVSLALMGGDGEIRRIEELLRERRVLLEPLPVLFDALVPVLTRLMLNVLLSPRGELSSELKDRLVIKPGELIVYFGRGYIDINSLPALKAIYGTIKPGDETKLCEEINDPIKYDCVSIVSRDYTMEFFLQEHSLRQELIEIFQRWISKGEVLDLLENLGLDAESLYDEFRRLLHELSYRPLLSMVKFSDCSTSDQLICSSVHLINMLYALINGNEKLAKAHTLAGAMNSSGKLPARLFLEAYRACCDPNNEEFRRAVAKLFFYHV
jgi:energy-coupling factor transporter ATP-binding protein EcfA2